MAIFNNIPEKLIMSSHELRGAISSTQLGHAENLKASGLGHSPCFLLTQNVERKWQM